MMRLFLFQKNWRNKNTNILIVFIDEYQTTTKISHEEEEFY